MCIFLCSECYMHFTGVNKQVNRFRTLNEQYTIKNLGGRFGRAKGIVTLLRFQLGSLVRMLSKGCIEALHVRAHQRS